MEHNRQLKSLNTIYDDSDNTAGDDAYETGEIDYRHIGLGVEDLGNGLNLVADIVTLDSLIGHADISILSRA
ncbi:hypothetical protein GQ457_17G001950 [Hibiscus cannabinus]